MSVRRRSPPAGRLIARIRRHGKIQRAAHPGSLPAAPERGAGRALRRVDRLRHGKSLRRWPARHNWAVPDSYGKEYLRRDAEGRQRSRQLSQRGIEFTQPASARIYAVGVSTLYETTFGSDLLGAVALGADPGFFLAVRIAGRSVLIGAQLARTAHFNRLEFLRPRSPTCEIRRG
jgi:hypothetical protein